MTKLLHTGRVLLGLVMLLACSTLPAKAQISLPLNEVGDYYYATCCLPFGVSNISGATAYVDEGIKDGYLVLKEVTDVAMNTGFLLIGKEDEAQLTIDLSATTTGGTNSVLLGTNVALEFDKDINRDDVLVLGKNNGQVGFYQPNENMTSISANKAYIKKDAVNASTIRLAFDDSTTGIKGVIFKTREQQEAPIYDLSGRRISKPVKGVYIQGGKKYIAR